MKRFFAMVVVLGMVATLAGMALAAEKKKTPDATLKLSKGQVAVGIGWSWGEGVLAFKGKHYSFKVEGLSVGDVGITKAEAESTRATLRTRQLRHHHADRLQVLPRHFQLDTSRQADR